MRFSTFWSEASENKLHQVSTCIHLNLSFVHVIEKSWMFSFSSKPESIKTGKEKGSVCYQLSQCAVYLFVYLFCIILLLSNKIHASLKYFKQILTKRNSFGTQSVNRPVASAAGHQIKPRPVFGGIQNKIFLSANSLPFMVLHSLPPSHSLLHPQQLIQ